MALDSKRWLTIYAVSMLSPHFLAFLTKKGDSKDGKPNLTIPWKLQNYPKPQFCIFLKISLLNMNVAVITTKMRWILHKVGYLMPIVLTKAICQNTSNLYMYDLTWPPHCPIPASLYDHRWNKMTRLQVIQHMPNTRLVHFFCIQMWK